MNGHLVLVLYYVFFAIYLFYTHFQINLLSSSHDARPKKMRNVVIYLLTIVFLLALAFNHAVCFFYLYEEREREKKTYAELFFFIEFFIHFGFVVRPVWSLFLTNFILFSQHLHARVDPLCAPCDFRSVLFYSIHLSISFVCIKQPVATLVPCYKVSINATLISLPLFLCCLFFLFFLRLFFSFFQAFSVT